MCAPLLERKDTLDGPSKMASARTVSLLAGKLRAFRAHPHVPTGVLWTFAGECFKALCCEGLCGSHTMASCRTHSVWPCKEPPVAPPQAVVAPISPATSYPVGGLHSPCYLGCCAMCSVPCKMPCKMPCRMPCTLSTVPCPLPLVPCCSMQTAALDEEALLEAALLADAAGLEAAGRQQQAALTASVDDWF